MSAKPLSPVMAARLATARTGSTPQAIQYRAVALYSQTHIFYAAMSAAAWDDLQAMWAAERTPPRQALVWVEIDGRPSHGWVMTPGVPAVVEVLHGR